MRPLLVIENLEKSFGTRNILQGINLEIDKGMITVILGESGSGKSVFLKHLCGLLLPDSGKIYFKGQEIQSFREKQWLKIREQITYIFQLGGLFDSLSIFENVAFPLRERGVSEESIPEKVSQSLHEVGLPDVSGLFPSALSGGMRKRVALARGLISRPEVILYDEPTTGLDPVMTAQVALLIQKITKLHKATAVVVTHDILFANQIADYLVMIYEGKIHHQGTRQTFAPTGDAVVKQFLEGRAEGPINPLRARS